MLMRCSPRPQYLKWYNECRMQREVLIIRVTNRGYSFCLTSKLSYSLIMLTDPAPQLHPLLPSIGVGPRSSTGQSHNFILLVPVVSFRGAQSLHGNKRVLPGGFSVGHGKGLLSLLLGFPGGCPDSASHFMENTFLGEDTLRPTFKDKQRGDDGVEILGP